MKVDIAVIEVGLGGRLDCTNIIKPILSVITNISLDHTQFLGDTLAKIAGEKAGIIKPGVTVVIGEANGETRPVFETKAREVGASIVFAEDSCGILSAEHLDNGGILYATKRHGDVKGELSGDYQVKNANTILAVADILLHNKILSEGSIAKGFGHVCESTGFMGRWQVLHTEPLVVCDTGHNTGGWQYLSRQIKAQRCRQLRMVFGMVDDKDINSVMEMLPKDATYYFTNATTHRAIPAQKVRQTGEKHGLKGSCYNSVNEAYEAALKDAANDDFVFVGGSSYVVADLLSGC